MEEKKPHTFHTLSEHSFDHPTRFNGLDLIWKEGWTYPTAEINGQKCAIKLTEGETEFSWPIIQNKVTSKWFKLTQVGWEGPLPRKGMLACPLVDWCSTCHKPKSACPCDSTKCPHCETVHYTESDMHICSCRIGRNGLSDHSTDAGKKVEDESSLLNIIRNQANLIENLIDRVSHLESKRSEGAERAMNLANSIDKMATLSLKTAERVTAITDREIKTSQKVAALHGSVQALTSRIKALEATPETTTE